MRETRIDLFANLPLTITTNATTNGNAIDFKDGYTGSYFEGAEVGYGFGVEILLTEIAGTAFNAKFKWQVSDDNSTWVDDQVIYDGELVAAVSGGTKLAIASRLRTPRRYGRLVVTTTNMNGTTETFKMNAWVSDGTTEHGYATQVRK